MEELKAEATGTVLFARPKFRLVESPSGAIGVHRDHWFWAVMAELLEDALPRRSVRLILRQFTRSGAADLYMNVYDRVVPERCARDALGAHNWRFSCAHCRSWFRIAEATFWITQRVASISHCRPAILEKTLGMRLEHKPASNGRIRRQSQIV